MGERDSAKGRRIILGCLLVCGIALAGCGFTKYTYDDLKKAEQARDGKAVVNIYRSLADSGDATAAVVLSYIAYDGSWGDPDKEMAWKYTKMAAAAGHPEGLFNLGLMHIDGSGGLAKDYGRARELFLRAVEKGFAAANCGLAYLERDGLGCSPDAKRAFDYELAAAKTGNPRSMYEVCLAYFRGKGVSKDVRRAYYWAVGAWTDPITREARDVAKRIEEEEKLTPADKQAVLEEIRAAAKAGGIEARWLFSLHRSGGMGVSKDPVQACAWLLRAPSALYTVRPMRGVEDLFSKADIARAKELAGTLR
ncbi:MAG TPA: tetratricopeptide repeat protein [Candidatus Ozemobacteraceae bacterium]